MQHGLNPLAATSRPPALAPCADLHADLHADLRADLLSIGRAAVRALHAELVLEPKPGLVSLRDSGSHDDMDAYTFVRSIGALRGYFGAIAAAGAMAAPFERLQRLGIDAELRMLRATGGANTHRGAIFCLGLLCAAAGRLAASGDAPTPAALRATLQRQWGPALHAHARQSAAAACARAAGLRPAADEAAAGMPTLFDHVLPALQAAREAGHGDDAARVQALFSAIAVLDDTNLVRRGGMAGLHDARRSAMAFLDAGGVAQPHWRHRARTLHAAFVARRLSPGGAADLLAAAVWLQTVCAPASACMLP